MKTFIGILCALFVTFHRNRVLADGEIVMDLLLPYPQGQHGAHHRRRFVRECQPERFGNLTHENWESHRRDDGEAAAERSPADVRYFAVEVPGTNSSRTVYGHHVVVDDPNRTVTILEPGGVPGGCGRHALETVAASAAGSNLNCFVAMNAGFFNISNGACLGQTVSDGQLAHEAGSVMQNAHFGIQHDGQLFAGYMPASDIEDGDYSSYFSNLVSGVLWLVRDGQNYVDVSKLIECPDAQSTSTLQGFIDVISGRTAIGHDRSGRLVLVQNMTSWQCAQIDGKTGSRGVNLYELANLLISFGVVNAVNLDGGGSATLVVNGTVINYPSDSLLIDNFTYGVVRPVSTIICVHDVVCLPSANCSGHGQCRRGVCQCDDEWNGPSCETATSAMLSWTEYWIWISATVLVIAVAAGSVVTNAVILTRTRSSVVISGH